jgi:putative DNA methylase
MAEPILTTETTRQSDTREYERSSAVVFLRTKEAFGGLSNMAGGFPLRVNGVRIATSEALYQACRFPHRPEVQRLVIEQNSPMTAKMKTKPYRDDSRPDWDRVRVKIMRWCLRVKLAQNYSTFSRLLLSTGDDPIVEESRKDAFWGAKPLDEHKLVGMNVLGRLLMELRKELREDDLQRLLMVPPLEIPDFLLYGQPIEVIQPSRLADLRPAQPIPAAKAHPEPPRAAPTNVTTEKMTKSVRKKLIEVSIPLEAINAASTREKSIRHGHPSTLHLWWARRPLAACRAVLFAQLVDDPSSWPERFGNDEVTIEAERKRLHKIIADMVPWEASNDETILNAARWEIARSVAWGLGEEPPPKDDGEAILEYLQTKAPPVYDPFSGGGSIPLEAQRLGLRAYGSDLNPVAVLIGKALVEIPPKFAGRPPVNPKSQAALKRGGRWNGKGVQGLAEDVRYYGQWMREEAEKRIGQLYPKAKLSDGSEATVIAWLWARTVRSPDPAAKGATVPLVSSFMVSTKGDKKAWVEPLIDPTAPEGWRFEVKTGALKKADEEQLKKGTKTGRGTHFTCVLTGAAITPDHVREEGNAHRLGARLMAIVAERASGRVYLSPTLDHETIATHAKPTDTNSLEVEMPDNARWFSPPGYGMKRYVDIFTPRQLVALTTFSDLVSEAQEKILLDVRAAGVTDDDAPLHAGGTGATAYADAVATYLGLIVSRLADRCSNLCSWDLRDGQGRKPGIRNVFSRQAIAMSWDYAETNPCCEIAASLDSSIGRIADVLLRVPVAGNALITNIDASRNSFPVRPIAISTDPPYYDNIGYADLSDFFYIWLRRSLADVWPDLFRRLLTPKAEELVATPYRHGGKDEAEAFFMKGMGEALTAMRKAATDGEPLAIYYAYKQSEIAEEGIFSPGWTSFLQAVVDAGLAVDGTWPVRTELSNRMIANETNALASSIVLVCRKRSADADVITRTDFVRALKREMPAAIDDIRKAGVGPVDMQQSVIGPGMGIFTRYAKVLEDDDSAMTVRIALSLINRVWDEIENELDANFDAETQVALAWFATYGFEVPTSGDLNTLANAKAIPSNVLFSCGVFKDLKGKAALTPRSDWWPAEIAPNDSDEEKKRKRNLAEHGTATVWACVQKAAAILNAKSGGGEAAGRFVAQMGSRSEAARALAYRLFEIATKKGWAAEALVYNELAQEWPKLEELASSAGVRTEKAAAQGTLQL